MIRRPPRSTRTDTLFPYTTLFRAKALGLCLNVLGLTVRKDGYGKNSWPLHKAILSWTQTNYMRLQAHNQKLAEACFVDSMNYDPEKKRIVKTYPIEGLRNEQRYEYLDLAPAPLEVKRGEKAVEDN